ncbi:hypothetical protein NLJ89_g7118 [Agrocybe chaxingu]|uniref:non-specific serine/threonine protein kinase n=1 Tax=Agrocybe chaxingu TaxID=84603 RepID=A0A9W8MTE9_9AGAR|nr:hypothetical protein NLJ89_g7118 [Agrocybe chaxingu]
MNGHNTGTHDSVVVAVEFKNKITSISSIPEIEIAGYFAHLNVSSSKIPDLMPRWRLPCLGITVIGHLVTFYAVISLGHRYRLVTLTPTLSCIPSASSTTDRTNLYRAFAAASVLEMHICADIQRVQSSQSPPIPSMNWRLPAVAQLLKYPPHDVESRYFQFEIIVDRRSDPTRLLFLARTPEGKTIVIKFTRQYCAKLHALCADLGYAPQLHAFERLPGGRYGIAMEYISDATPLYNLSRAHPEREHWYKEIRRVMTAFHAEGLVHGDLRDVNILVYGKSRVLLVDFDWGGQDGVAVYPRWKLHPDLRNGRQHRDLKIRKEDDERILESALSITS